jgi:hypothetical protein
LISRVLLRASSQRVGLGLEPRHRVHVLTNPLLAGRPAIATPQEVEGRPAEGSHHEGVWVTRQVTLMFPKAHKCLLQDIVRMGLAPGPLTRD